MSYVRELSNKHCFYGKGIHNAAMGQITIAERFELHVEPFCVQDWSTGLQPPSPMLALKSQRIHQNYNLNGLAIKDGF